MKKKLIIPIIILIILLIVGVFLLKLYNEEKTTTKKSKQKEETILKDNGIFKKYYKESEKLVKTMSLEEKVGQIFLVRYRKEDVDYLSNFYPGGYILFAKDFENHTKDEMKQELDYDMSKNKYPLILGVDEEGGFVTRVSRYPAFRKEKFQSPRFYYEQGGYELLENIEKEKAELLKSIGINLNLAPVVDIPTNETDFIYNRSFSTNRDEVVEFSKKMVDYSINNNINITLKHFPGYGNNIDTHTSVAIDERSYENFLENDYKPFEAGIKAGVPSILVSHNIVKCIDNEYPSSLSKKVISELREKLGFTGIIITDDLAMDAVKEYVEDNRSAVMAVSAGNDMIITSDFITMKNELIDAVKNGELDEKIIDKKVVRIIAWKYYSNLFKGEKYE